MDLVSGNDFLSSGNDHQCILWRMEKETKVIYKGQDYAIDHVRSINQDKFISSSMDGSIYLYSSKKNKPLWKKSDAHNRWVTALDSLKQTDLVASAGGHPQDRCVKLWALEAETKSGMKQIQEASVEGIVSALQVTQSFLALAESDEHRLGRWITAKVRNRISIYPFY